MKTGSTQISKRHNRNAAQQLFELETPIQGFTLVIVSIKSDGSGGLSASYFIWGTVDGVNPEKELAWDLGEKEYTHEDVLKRLIKNQ